MPTITPNLNRAILDLRQGKPVAIPTETVYGLAAMIDQESAIKAVFTMKNRPLNHPLIVHVAQDTDLTEWVEELPAYAQKLIDHFWPGPLTLVLRSKPNAINPLISGGQTTVAMRCPNHPIAQKLLLALKTPLVAPSANPFGKISPATAEHVKRSFPESDLTILDGGRCEVGIESTIIDATDPDGYQILRHGLIDEHALSAVIAAGPLKKENTTRVPGRLESHYQPQKTLYYFDDYESLSNFCQKRAGDVFAIASTKPLSVDSQYFRPLATQAETAAFDLYFQLREADESHVICIAIELPPNESAWQGVRERILKAGLPYSINPKP